MDSLKILVKGRLFLAFFLVLSVSFAARMCRGIEGYAWTEVPVQGGQYHSFSFWYDIPSRDGRGLVEVVEIDGDGMVWVVHNFPVSHTNGWRVTGEQIFVGKPIETVGVALRCSQHTAFFDSVTLGPSPRSNVLPNPSFEVWIDTLDPPRPDGWFTNAWRDSGSAYKSTHAFAGLYSLALASTPVGVEEVEYAYAMVNEPSLNVHPNPCRDYAEIRALLNGEGLTSLQIYDTSGRLVRSYEISGSGPVTVDWDGRDHASSPVPSGTYFIRLDSGSKTVCERIAVIR